jgi:hypothetical protein
MLFAVALVMLFIGMFAVLFSKGYGIPGWELIRQVLGGLLVAGVYLCLLSIFLLDTLTSIEQAQMDAAKYAKQAEEHLYNLYLIEVRKQKGKKE